MSVSVQALKFCVVARKVEADIYPRLSPTSEWDTAAGHAVLLAAGGSVDGPDGTPLALREERFHQSRVRRHRRLEGAADRAVPRTLFGRGRASSGNLIVGIVEKTAPAEFLQPVGVGSRGRRSSDASQRFQLDPGSFETAVKLTSFLRGASGRSELPGDPLRSIYGFRQAREPLRAQHDSLLH
jgi:hypothetical protein